MPELYSAFSFPPRWVLQPAVICGLVEDSHRPYLASYSHAACVWWFAAVGPVCMATTSGAHGRASEWSTGRRFTPQPLSGVLATQPTPLLATRCCRRSAAPLLGAVYRQVDARTVALADF